MMSVWITREQRSLFSESCFEFVRGKKSIKLDRNVIKIAQFFFNISISVKPNFLFQQNTLDAFLFMSSSSFIKCDVMHIQNWYKCVDFKSNYLRFFLHFVSKHLLILQEIEKGGWQYPPTISWMNRWIETDG